MAPPTISIFGPVQTPSGALTTGGSFVVRLSGPGSATDSQDVNVQHRVGNGPLHGIINSAGHPKKPDGIANFRVIPTDLITPAGHTYRIAVTTPEGDWEDVWETVPTGSSVEWGDL